MKHCNWKVWLLNSKNTRKRKSITKWLKAFFSTLTPKFISKNWITRQRRGNMNRVSHIKTLSTQDWINSDQKESNLLRLFSNRIKSWWTSVDTGATILTTKNWWRRLEVAPNWWRRNRPCKRTPLLAATYTLSWTISLITTTRKKDEVKSKVNTIKVILRQLKTMPFTTTRNVEAAWTSSRPSTSARTAFSGTTPGNKKQRSKELEMPSPITKQLLISLQLIKDRKTTKLEQTIDKKDW